jgi:S-adenosylmethionine hydrolase
MEIITFISDFGSKDWFVPAVKGEILKIAPSALIVDITHDIAPYDVRGAAFVLGAVYGNFPAGTVHLAVVDPGVGGERKPLAVESHGHHFVGPDNGLFSYIYEKKARVYEIVVDAKPSSTFHARDIFGPTAARLASGCAVEELARQISGMVCFERPEAGSRQGRLYGEIIYIDHFGNCITNLPTHNEIRRIVVSGRDVQLKKNYCEGNPGELICVRGSLGYYEIACPSGNARDQLEANIGTRVEAF